MKTTLLLSLAVLTLTLQSCGKKAGLESSDEETAQQMGDSMASIDEAGGSSGTLGFNSLPQEKIFRQSAPLFARFGQELKADRFSLLDQVIPDAQATNCSVVPSYGFSSCSSNIITRTFGGCTWGLATIAGTVTLTWGGNSASCLMVGTGATVTRVPSFTVTGLRDAVLTVSKSGTIGQRLTWTSGTGTEKVFSFTNDGIQRTFALNGTTLLDFTTTTTSAITVTGTNRTGRTINGGNLRVVNNRTSVTCDYVPTNILWASAACNCPTSGSWAGTCSNGKTSTLTLNGCGVATYEVGSDLSGTVRFDRCL